MSGLDSNVRKRFKMTPAPDATTEGSHGFLFYSLVYLFIEIYNNRINIYLEYILEKT